MLDTQRPSYRPGYTGADHTRETRAIVNIRHVFGRVTAVVVTTTGLAALGLTGVASASTARPAVPAFATTTQVCSIQSFDGHYLSAIDGGGRTTDVIETNRTSPGSWETFTLFSSSFGGWAIRTSNGHFLSAISGGGRTSDVIETNRTAISTWETFTLVPLSGLGPNFFAIMTLTGNYLTAVNSGGIGSAFEAIHSNATQIGTWEEFYFSCHLAS
jgi:hypothetical protein